MRDAWALFHSVLQLLPPWVWAALAGLLVVLITVSQRGTTRRDSEIRELIRRRKGVRHRRRSERSTRITDTAGSR